jgi:UDP-2,4-diacetamido-2,4,6-trideoxy-beta-L-altropyranose hydrolase
MLTKGNYLLVRTDADAETGLGHVMRCLALAQAWQDIGGRVGFALARCTEAMANKLTEEQIDIHWIYAEVASAEDAVQTVEIARRYASSIVIDGYQFCWHYQMQLKQAGKHLLCVDDYCHHGQYCANTILNPNAYAFAEEYLSKATGAQLLLGSRYTLLRREFSTIACEAHQGQIEKILVTLGGADSLNLTSIALEGMKYAERNLEIRAILGSANPRTLEIKQQFDQIAEIVIDAKHMAEHMQWADLAISAAGGTFWELARLAVPSLLLVAADNQCRVAQYAQAQGAAINLGWHTLITPETIADAGICHRMSAQAERLCDGKGAIRVARYLAYEGERFP